MRTAISSLVAGPTRTVLALWIILGVGLAACVGTSDGGSSSPQISSESGGAGELDEAAPSTSTSTTTTTTAPTTTLPPYDEPAVFVDAERGRDGASGTLDDPFRKPREAIRILQPGDTLYFRGGTYSDLDTDHVLGTIVGTPDAWITLTPFPEEAVVIDAGGMWGNGFELIASSYVVIDGFTMLGRDDSEHGAGVRLKDQSHNVVIRNNLMENFGAAGISATQSAMVTMEYNEVRGTARRSFYQGSGLSIYEPIGPDAGPDEYSNIIRGNLVVSNYTEVFEPETGLLTDGNCIILDLFSLSSYTGRNLVENNTCIDNGGRGIHVFRTSNTDVINNTLIHDGWSPDLFGGRAELTASGDNVLFANNLVISLDGVAPWLADASLANVTFVNNAFTAGPLPPGDTNLLLPPGLELLASLDPDSPRGTHTPLADSGLVGSGDPAFGSSIDGSGNPRPSSVSIGAWEP